MSKESLKFGLSMLAFMLVVVGTGKGLVSALGPSRVQLEREIKYIADTSRNHSVDKNESKIVFERLGLTYREGYTISDLSKDQMSRYIRIHKTSHPTI